MNRLMAGRPGTLPWKIASAAAGNLPAIGDQLRYRDEHGHEVLAYRRGHHSWVLNHTSRSGGEVLRFYSTAQLLADLSRVSC